MDFQGINQWQITLTPDSATDKRALPQSLRQFAQLGQIVTATVAAPSKQNQGLLTLNINGTLLNGALMNTKPDKPLSAGDTLDLKVTQLPSLPIAKALNVPIQQVSQSQNALLLTLPEPLLKSLQTGTVLQAITAEQKPNGQTLLDINGQLLQGDTLRALAKGLPIALRINYLGTPALAQIIDMPGRTGTQATVTDPSVRLLLPSTLQNRIHLGDNLQSTVMNAASNGKAMLNINGTHISALTTLPLTQGQQLQLQMTELGKPPVLAPVEYVKPENRVMQAMRQLLPQQSSLPEIIGNLTALAQPTTLVRTAMDSASPSVAEQLRFLAREIIQQLPRYTDASTANGLKSALQQSGLFLEGNLATAITHQQSIPAGDLKANLLRLLAILQRQLAALDGKTKTGSTRSSQTQTSVPTPPMRHTPPQAQPRVAASITRHASTQAMLNDLMRQVSGALARIQLTQLTNLKSEDEPARVLQSELPIRHDHGSDVFQIRIEEDSGDKQQKQKRVQSWSVTLAFDIGKFGPIHVKLTLMNDTINTTFWAEQEQTKHLIDSQLYILHKNYVKAGLGIGHMVCHHGTPPQPASSKTQSAFILDVKA